MTTRSSDVWRASTWRALSKAALPVGTADVISVSMRRRCCPSHAKSALAAQATTNTRQRMVPPRFMTGTSVGHDVSPSVSPSDA